MKIPKTFMKAGIKVESEHANVYYFMKGYLKKHGHLPPKKAMYAQIVQSHYKENPLYYKKLARLKL